MNSQRRVVQSDRLRDQVYRMLREDLQNDTFAAGQRLVEVELAAQYGVSRTPVREALFQLAREGLIEDSDRGYCLPVDTHDDFLDRLSARISLDPTLAAHAAARATAQQRATLEKLYGEMQDAHAANRTKSFASSAHQFRLTLIDATHNNALIRVCLVLEDQFLIVRNKMYRDTDNRDIAVEFEGRLLKEIKKADQHAAAEAARAYMDTLIRRFGDADAKALTPGEPWVAKHRAASKEE
ncbi:GntR family transcriptional regulator [Cupriavidus pauculus]|uniref:GntR family transcriptional regulator n=1 Tax=Cupriavidus pauculus TaxID=82633 RepID=UPI0030F70778